jgi:predicted DsbA family dithiol-disulfide isomerase
MAQNLGVTGTPAFVVNGVLVNGAKSYEEFVRLIDQELARAPRQ